MVGRSPVEHLPRLPMIRWLSKPTWGRSWRTVLKVEKLDVYYGNIRALHEVSFEVKQGEIVTLIGANGAGKTTVLHAISGLVPARSGSIRFLDQELTALAPHKIVQLGLAHVPEGRRIFANLTVKENLEMG